MSTLSEKNIRYVDQSISIVEAKVTNFLCIYGVKKDAIFLNNSIMYHRGNYLSKL